MSQSSPYLSARSHSKLAITLAGVMLLNGCALIIDPLENNLPPIKHIEASEVDVLIINALRVEKHYSHLNLNDALDIINKIGPKVAYLTHISHKLGFHKDVQAQLPKNVFLAYDGLEVVLD